VYEITERVSIRNGKVVASALVPTIEEILVIIKGYSILMLSPAKSEDTLSI
jgi:hypothetical protein